MSHDHCQPLSIPYTAPLPSTLYKGRSIVINGVSKLNSARFTVNLVCGPMTEIDDVAFHFDVRFNMSTSRGIVVRNSKIRGKWGKEESSASYFPFTIDSPYEIMICVKSNKFKVFVNNCHFTDFKYRIPVDKVTYLIINGDVSLNNVVL
ncbi:Galectin-4 [Bulinus truncatus]|nr:Galectin-4 [Bulinus truncatus]